MSKFRTLIGAGLVSTLAALPVAADSFTLESNPFGVNFGPAANVYFDRGNHLDLVLGDFNAQCETDEGDFSNDQACSLSYNFAIKTSKNRPWNVRTNLRSYDLNGTAEHELSASAKTEFGNDTLKLVGVLGITEQYRALGATYEGLGPIDVWAKVKHLDSGKIDQEGAVVLHGRNIHFGLLHKSDDSQAYALVSAPGNSGIFSFGKRDPHSGNYFAIAEVGEKGNGLFDSDNVLGTFGAMTGVPPFVSNMPMNTSGISGQIGAYENDAGKRFWLLGGGRLNSGLYGRIGASYDGTSFGLPIELHLERQLGATALNATARYDTLDDRAQVSVGLKTTW